MCWYVSLGKIKVFIDCIFQIILTLQNFAVKILTELDTFFWKKTERMILNNDWTVNVSLVKKSMIQEDKKPIVKHRTQ